MHNLDSRIIFTNDNICKEMGEKFATPTPQICSNYFEKNVIGLLYVKIVRGIFFASAHVMSKKLNCDLQTIFSAKQEDINCLKNFIRECFEVSLDKKKVFSEFIQHDIENCVYCSYSVCCFKTTSDLICKLLDISINHVEQLADLIFSIINEPSSYCEFLKEQDLNCFYQVFLLQHPQRIALSNSGQNSEGVESKNRLFLALTITENSETIRENIVGFLESDSLKSLIGIMCMEFTHCPRRIIAFVEQRFEAYILNEIFVCLLEGLDIIHGKTPLLLLETQNLDDEIDTENRVFTLVGHGSNKVKRFPNIEDNLCRNEAWDHDLQIEDIDESDNDIQYENIDQRLRKNKGYCFLFNGLSANQQKDCVDMFYGVKQNCAPNQSGTEESSLDTKSEENSHTLSPSSEVSDLQIEQDRLRVLVCTSVAEEGLDIPICDCVINFNTPDTARRFVQRRGRARAQDARLYSCNPKDCDKYTDLIKCEEIMYDVLQNLDNSGALDVYINPQSMMLNPTNNVQRLTETLIRAPNDLRREFNYEDGYGVLKIACEELSEILKCNCIPVYCLKSISHNGDKQFRGKVGLPIEMITKIQELSGGFHVLSGEIGEIGEFLCSKCWSYVDSLEMF